MHTIWHCFTVLKLINSIMCDHSSERQALWEKDNALALGSSIILDEKEACVSDNLLDLKLTELERGLNNPNNFYPRTNFLETVKYIDSSEVFKIIKKIPKGAALHVHDMALAPTSFLYKLTFSENLYVCRTQNNRLLLNFFQFHVDNRCEWVLIESAREADGFEDLLLSQLAISTPSSSNKVAWNKLMGTFATVEGLISYKPIFTSYLTEVLKQMYDDNVMYVELRTMLLPIYDLEGNEYGPTDVARILKDMLEDFKCLHTDFLGGKIIYSPARPFDQSWMDYYMEMVDELTTKHSDFVAGFDLMGQEDVSYPLSKLVGSLESMANKISYFFSAGETNWMGSVGDLNLYDAVLFSPTRIGHAFSLFTHPEILKLIKKSNIAIELCPISNQMMMLVGDLRNHPGKYLISQGYPVVISSDNPGFWGASTLSHDWYMVFMAMSGMTSDLKLLKQLAINSMQYSSFSKDKDGFQMWKHKWSQFINESCSAISKRSDEGNFTRLENSNNVNSEISVA